MHKILVTPRSLSANKNPALNLLEKAGCDIITPFPGVMPEQKELYKIVPSCSGWLAGVEPITADLLKNAVPTLKVISRNGVGVDNIDMAAAGELGIAVKTTPGANANGVAELALALMLNLARCISPGHESIKNGGWHRKKGFELEGKVLGIVGCGQIGKCFAQKSLRLGMKVLAYDPFPDKEFRPNNFSYTMIDEVIT